MRRKLVAKLCGIFSLREMASGLRPRRFLERQLGVSGDEAKTLVEHAFLAKRLCEDEKAVVPQGLVH